MKWTEFNETDLPIMYDGQVRTDIECPICGKKILWDSRVVLTSLPPKYCYWCECGWTGNSFVKWKK